MIRNALLLMSSLCVLIGATLSIVGIFDESFKVVLAGFVLIAAAAVLATLHLGARRIA